jgi:hypothetical protein
VSGFGKERLSVLSQRVLFGRAGCPPECEEPAVRTNVGYNQATKINTTNTGGNSPRNGLVHMTPVVPTEQIKLSKITQLK